VTVNPANMCTACICNLVLEPRLCVGRKGSWCTVRCYSTVTPGDLKSSVIIYVTITCRPITPFHTPTSFPTCTLQPPKRNMNALALTLLKAATVSSTNSRCSALKFGSHTCIRHRERSNNFKLNMHSVAPVESILSTQLSAACPNPAWANFPGSKPE